MQLAPQLLQRQIALAARLVALGEVEGAQGLLQRRGGLDQPLGRLPALQVRVQHLDQPVDQEADAAIVGRHRRLPHLLAAREVLGGEGRVHEGVAVFGDHRGRALGRPGFLERGDILVVHQMDLLHAGIAQEQHVVERLAVPVLRPAILAVQLQQRGVQPAVPLAGARFRRLAALLLELEIVLGQHQEQGVAHRLAALGRGAVGGGDPGAHHPGQILHLGHAGRHAQQHRGELELVGVALEQIGDLAAQEELAGLGAALVRRLGQVGELEPRARARKVEQVGVLEERPGFLGDHEADLGDQRGQRRARQGGRRSGLARGDRHQRNRVGLIRLRAKPSQYRHVDDAVGDGADLARDQRRGRRLSLCGVPDPVQRADQRHEHLGEAVELAPEQREQRRPVAQAEPAAMLDQRLPIVGAAERADARAEILVEILGEVEQRDLVEMRHAAAGGRRGLGRLHGGADRRLVERLDRHVVGVEIQEEAVGEDLDQIGLGQQAQPDRKCRVDLAMAQREPGHQAGRTPGRRPG